MFHPCRFLVTLLIFVLSGVSDAQEKPNIVLIMADDLGYGSIGCYGSKDIKTPQIDKLASQGLRLTDFHSNGAVCSPTRAALLTGRYQQRAGVDGVITAKSHRNKGMGHDQWTFAEMLKEQGYQTAAFGKWHLGYSERYNPTTHGFDQFEGFVSGNVDQFSHVDQEGWFDWWIGKNKDFESGYVPNKITDKALSFIEESKDKPFFLYLPYPAPHYPYQGPKDSPNRKVTNGVIPSGHEKLKLVQKHKGPAVKKAFIEMIEDLDDQVGRIVHKLDKLAIRKNTIIIFCSDNGGATKKNLGNRRNANLRGGKGTVFEGGHRVPCVINWPGKISPAVSGEAVMTFDFMPTIADFIGLKPKVKFDGVSLKGLLMKGQEIGPRKLLWSFKKKTAYRDGRWKVVWSGKKTMLFDLESDMEEQKDLAAEKPNLLRRLSDEAQKLRQELNSTKKIS